MVQGKCGAPSIATDPTHAPWFVICTSRPHESFYKNAIKWKHCIHLLQPMLSWPFTHGMKPNVLIQCYSTKVYLRSAYLLPIGCDPQAYHLVLASKDMQGTNRVHLSAFFRRSIGKSNATGNEDIIIHPSISPSLEEMDWTSARRKRCLRGGRRLHIELQMDVVHHESSAVPWWDEILLLLFPSFHEHDVTNPSPSHSRRKNWIKQRTRGSPSRTGVRIRVQQVATSRATLHDTSTPTSLEKDENRSARFGTHVTKDIQRNGRGRRNRRRKGYQVQGDRKWPFTRTSQGTLDPSCMFVLHPTEKQKPSRACVMRDTKQEHCPQQNNPSRSTNRSTSNT